MKYLKEYYNYDNKVAEICLKYNIDNWSIRDGLVDVDGGVHLNNKNLSELPLKFGRVSGDFWCDSNQLTTLEGAPESVVGDFDCSDNKLNTLEGAPKSVGGYFWCDSNQLTTLEGAPKWISRDFGCGYNKLNTLEGAPKSVNGYFNCSYNQLTTLEHFPNVKDDIYINKNPLPKEIYDNVEHLKQIIELQDDYDIWRDSKLYLPRFNQLMLDIKEDKK